MICRQVQSHLDDYILNQIEKELFDEIDNHLKECSDCQQRLKVNKQLILSLQSISTPDPGDIYWQQMEDSILARALNNNKNELELPDRERSEPITVFQRYLIPLAASFALLFGALMLSNSIQSGIQTTNISSIKMLAENNEELSDESQSQIFTAIVSGTPGSLGKQLVFLNITGGAR